LKRTPSINSGIKKMFNDLVTLIVHFGMVAVLLYFAWEFFGE